MSDKKAIDIVEGAQAAGDAKSGPIVLDEEEGDWLLRYLKKKRERSKAK